MENLSTSSPVNNSSDFFSGVFEKRHSLTIGVVLSILSIFVYIPILLCVIWYEKFGSDKKRTVLNKLVASVCWSAIYSNLLCQIPEIIRYCFGPLPTLICCMHFVVKNVFAIQMILLYDAITVMRYLFIFWLKNPSSFCDDFWTTYINVWIFSFSLISQTAHVILPGNTIFKIHFSCKISQHFYPPYPPTSTASRTNFIKSKKHPSVTNICKSCLFVASFFLN